MPECVPQDHILIFNGAVGLCLARQSFIAKMLVWVVTSRVLCSRVHNASEFDLKLNRAILIEISEKSVFIIANCGNVMMPLIGAIAQP